MSKHSVISPVDHWCQRWYPVIEHDSDIESALTFPKRCPRLENYSLTTECLK